MNSSNKIHDKNVEHFRKEKKKKNMHLQCSKSILWKRIYNLKYKVDYICFRFSIEIHTYVSKNLLYVHSVGPYNIDKSYFKNFNYLL